MEEIALYLEFATVDGKKKSIKVYDPKEDLTGEQIKAVMDWIIENEIFDIPFVASKGAKIITRVVEKVEI